jgi:hypothetical protein
MNLNLSRTAVLRAVLVALVVWSVSALVPLTWTEASSLLQATDTPTKTPTPTNTPTATPFMADQYEVNNTFSTAYAISVNTTVSKISFYPVGDVDYFKFWGKANRTYEVRTVMVDGGLDSYMRVFGPAGAGQLLGENDDASAGDLGSLVIFRASQDGFYYVELSNRDPTDPIGKTYQLKVTEVPGTPSVTPTSTATSPTSAGPTATFTPIPGADPFEPNWDFDHATILAAGVQYDNLNFVPWAGSDPNQQDNDFYRVWVKPGLFYSCETFNLSPGTDTNMILYTGPSVDQGVAGNDDRAPGDFSSLVSWYPNYTGWLYILVGPVWGGVPPNQLAPFTYSIKCMSGQPSTPTPFPTSTPRPASPGPLPTYTALPTYTPYPSSTPSPTSETGAQVPTPSTTPTPQPIPLNILPLPTSAAVGPIVQVMTIDVLVYYDGNQNLNPELDEGVRDVAVAVYDTVSNELLAFGYTNESGGLHFGPLNVMGAARVEIPFLGYSRRITGTSEQIEIRIAPRPLPLVVP